MLEAQKRTKLEEEKDEQGKSIELFKTITKKNKKWCQMRAWKQVDKSEVMTETLYILLKNWVLHLIEKWNLVSHFPDKGAV